MDLWQTIVIIQGLKKSLGPLPHFVSSLPVLISEACHSRKNLKSGSRVSGRGGSELQPTTAFLPPADRHWSL
jgi:hypothetical protein